MSPQPARYRVECHELRSHVAFTWIFFTGFILHIKSDISTVTIALITATIIIFFLSLSFHLFYVVSPFVCVHEHFLNLCVICYFILKGFVCYVFSN